MKLHLTIRAFALATCLAFSACETDDEATTTSSTVTEETSSVHPVHPVHSSTTTTTRELR